MAKHAPQGPRIAKDVIHVPNAIYVEGLQGAPLRCHATSKSTGKRCGSPAIAGATVCRMHGGSTPQVKAAARERLMALQPKAIQVLNELLDAEDFPTVRLGAARDILDRTEGKAKESVQITVEEAHTLTDEQIRQRIEQLASALGSLPGVKVPYTVE